MAAVFGFKVRRPERDQETDRLRHKRLMTLIDDIAAEIDAERTGLEGRYKVVSADAAFLMEAIENAESPRHSKSRMNQLVDANRAYSARLSTLSRYLQMIGELRSTIDGLLPSQGVDDAVIAPRADP